MTTQIKDPKTITCGCGKPLVLDSSWANECECGREYNGGGQQLAPRSQWGAETGESIADMERPMDEEEW